MASYHPDNRPELMEEVSFLWEDFAPWLNHLGSFVQKSPGAGEDGQPRRAVRSHQHPAVSGEGLHQGQRQEQGFIQFATFLTWNR